MRNVIISMLALISLSCASGPVNEMVIPIEQDKINFCYIEQEDMRFALYTHERRMLGTWSSFDTAWRVAKTMQCPVAISSF